MQMLRCLGLCTLMVAGLPGAYGVAQDMSLLDLHPSQYADHPVMETLPSDLALQYFMAWVLFASATSPGDGTAENPLVPSWMSWPTDLDTFPKSGDPDFTFGKPVKAGLDAVVAKETLAALEVGDACAAEVEVVARNRISYDYLVSNRLYTQSGVAAYLADNDIEMPNGAYEIKGVFVPLTAYTDLQGETCPPVEDVARYDDAFHYVAGDGARFAWAGMHIMVKLQPTPEDLLNSEAVSWFWTTFEYAANPGLANIRKLNNTRDTTPPGLIGAVQAHFGLSGTPLENYSPNGVQVSFTRDESAVILGHSMLEDFAGGTVHMLNKAAAESDVRVEPEDFTFFASSCHSCHAVASVNPENANQEGFAFPMPLVIGPVAQAVQDDLAQAYRQVDFMWPIPFQARAE